MAIALQLMVCDKGAPVLNPVLAITTSHSDA